MSVEFIGFIANSNASETIVRQGPVLDPAYICLLYTSPSPRD